MFVGKTDFKELVLYRISLLVLKGNTVMMCRYITGMLRRATCGDSNLRSSTRVMRLLHHTSDKIQYNANSEEIHIFLRSFRCIVFY